jgi:hypothetical protein
MKKIMIVVLVGASLPLVASASRFRLLGRLGVIELFKRSAQLKTRVPLKNGSELAKQYPVFTKEQVAIRELFPTKPSPASALILAGFSSVWTSLVEFRNSFRSSYRDHSLVPDLAHYQAQEVLQNYALEQHIAEQHNHLPHDLDQRMAGA